MRQRFTAAGVSVERGEMVPFSAAFPGPLRDVIAPTEALGSIPKTQLIGAAAFSFEAPRCDRVVAAVFEQIEAIDQSSPPMPQ